MKYFISIISLLLVYYYPVSHADENRILNMLESRWDETNRLGYELFLMGDKAIPYLIENLTHDDQRTRENAIQGIQEYYPEPSVMSALTVVFIHSEDNLMREKSAHTMAEINAEFAKKFMAKHLDADQETQRIAIDVLLKLKDERVIPYLVEQIDNPRTGPERRRNAVYGLADFRDKRAIPELLKILSQPNVNAIQILEESIQKTAQIDDPRTVSVLMEAMDPDSDLGRRVANSITTSVINSMSKFGLASIQKMLETAKVTEAIEVEQIIYKILRKVQNKEVIPLYKNECLDTDNDSLKPALIFALKNMGQEGFDALLEIAKHNPSPTVLTALTTFNRTEAIEVVGTIALNSSSKLRLHAIESLIKFGPLWDNEIIKYISQLLDDLNPDVRISAINIIRKMKLTEMIPKLEELAKDSRGNTRNAAFMTIDELSEKTPLELKIEMVSKKYDYRHPIALKYTLRNTSDYPVKVGFKRDVSSGYLKLEIKQPDGTFSKVVGQNNRIRTSATNEYYHTIVKDGDDEIILLPVTPNNFNILQPNEVITNIIPVSNSFHLFQTGHYTVKLKMFFSPWKPVPAPKRSSLEKAPPLGSEMKSNQIAWEKTLISANDSFEIKEPTPRQFNEMLKMLDANHINNYSIKQLTHICFQLGELRKPEAIQPLKFLSSPLNNVRSSSRRSLGVSAHKALLNYTDTDMTQQWLQIIDKQNKHRDIVADVIYRLSETGDKKDIKPLYNIFLQSANKGASTEIAFILSQLGDASCLQWIRSVADRKLRSSDNKLRLSAAILLSQLKQPDAKEIRLPISIRDDFSIGEIHKYFHLIRPIWHTSDIEHLSLRNPWFYAKYYDTNFNITEIQKNAETVDGLKELLADENLNIQRAAAYDLASLGDKSGIHLIEKDLHANNSATRLHARQFFVKLQSE